MTERLHFHFSLSCTGEGNSNPLQYSSLESPRDRGAWWAAIYGVAQSWTLLMWLSSSSMAILSFPIAKDGDILTVRVTLQWNAKENFLKKTICHVICLAIIIVLEIYSSWFRMKECFGSNQVSFIKVWVFIVQARIIRCPGYQPCHNLVVERIVLRL